MSSIATAAFIKLDDARGKRAAWIPRAPLRDTKWISLDIGAPQAHRRAIH